MTIQELMGSDKKLLLKLVAYFLKEEGFLDAITAWKESRFRTLSVQSQERGKISSNMGLFCVHA